MRKTVLITAALLMLAGSAHAFEEPTLLTGKNLRNAVSGKTIYIQTPIGAEVPIRYRPNGTMEGTSSTRLAALAGEQVNVDTGRWWVRRAELCQQWSKWSKGRAHCYKLRAAGKKVHWSRNDGETGTARLGK
jgi:hypothetical protein